MDTEAVKIKREELKALERQIAELPYNVSADEREELQIQWRQKHNKFLELLKEDTRKLEADLAAKQAAKQAASEAEWKAQMANQLKKAVAETSDEGPEPETQVETAEEPASTPKPKSKKNKG